MTLVQLSDYTLAPKEAGAGIRGCHFSLARGDIFAIRADNADDAHLFLRALATLVYPQGGTYHFKARPLDFTNYRRLLACKRKVGYLATDAALLNNRTVRENLLFAQYYEQNSFQVAIAADVLQLCRLFELHTKLDMRATELNQRDVRHAVAVRELAKGPEFLLIERPEELFGNRTFPIFVKVFRKIVRAKIPVVFLSYHNDFVRTFARKQVVIARGILTTV